MAMYVRWFDEIGMEDVALVGGKNASLGEMMRELTPLGIKVPDGFAVTATAYKRALDTAGIRGSLQELLGGIDKTNVDELGRRAAQARDLVFRAGIPDEVWDEIRDAYDRMRERAGGRDDVAVRSSATAEDLPTASFAGQQESFLNIRGHAALRDACARCFASLFTDRAISYRIDQGFDHFKVALSIGVQRMVRADRASSGVVFTLDTETGFRDVVLVTAAYGLGENVVKGTVDPDELYVHKPTLRLGKRSIMKKRLGSKELRLVYAEGAGPAPMENRPVPDDERRRFCVEADEVLELARQALRIEDHYQRKAGEARPMDIEWAKDGLTGELFIVQARPETVHGRRSADVLVTYVLEEHPEPIATGLSIGQKIGSGPARVIDDVTRLGAFVDGEVLVADATTPDWEPVLKRAAAVVTNRGGRTCHAAIVARELDIPAVVGAEGATARLRSGQELTVSCAEGEVGRVYGGRLRYRIDRTTLSELRRPRTKVMMNLGDPEQAFALSFIPNDGVGLARIEFIISGAVQIHPMALLHPERVEDPEARRAIDELTRSYPDRAEYFVDTLAQGVATIAAAFYPKPVIVRFSDFKTNEYARLIGGAAFEPHEENPMIGFRGAARYAHPMYAEAFGLECRALRRVREDMGLVNVRVMIPFCRRVEEGRRVLAEISKHGLVQGENGLEVYVMCEIPNNVASIDAFCWIFDGISIGSNDLTQLVLGVDRDSAIVAFDFDERDPGVVEMIRQALVGAHRNGRHAGICGQAPSDHPDLAQDLVRLGIDSISLNPDTVLRTTLAVLEIEERLSSESSAAPSSAPRGAGSPAEPP